MPDSGKTIQIYCPSGDPRGVRIAEITTRIVQAVVVPRNQLDEACNREELQGVGLYFLFSSADPESALKAYIGEAEDCSIRMKDHHRDPGKDFWTIAVAIVSRTGSFTKAHVRLLEWLSIERSSQSNRYRLENRNSGIRPTVPEWMESDVNEVFETAVVLLGALGFHIFQPRGIPLPSRDEIYICTKRRSDAKLIFTDEGFVVLRGSRASPDITPSGQASIGPKRANLLSSGQLVDTLDGPVFQQDVVFSTPSAAADIVIGNSSNGWIEWRDGMGRTLDEVHRRTQ